MRMRETLNLSLNGNNSSTKCSMNGRIIERFVSRIQPLPVIKSISNKNEVFKSKRYDNKLYGSERLAQFEQKITVSGKKPEMRPKHLRI